MKTALIRIQHTRLTFYVLLSGIVFFCGFYMYCINSAVRFAVVRNNALDKISSIQDNLSELETKYMQNSSNITLESAKSKGFVDPTVKDFISKLGASKPISYNSTIR